MKHTTTIDEDGDEEVWYEEINLLASDMARFQRWCLEVLGRDYPPDKALEVQLFRAAPDESLRIWVGCESPNEAMLIKLAWGGSGVG